MRGRIARLVLALPLLTVLALPGAQVVRAECVFIDPWPRITVAAPTAKRVVVGTVSDVKTWSPKRNREPEVVSFTLDVTEDVKGSGHQRIRLGKVATDFGCIQSRLWVRDGDRLAVAFGGDTRGIAGPVSAVAFVGPEPAAGIAHGWRHPMPNMEQVTVKQVRQAARLPRGPLLIFVADDGSGPALWRTDGTARGTAIVRKSTPKGPMRPRDLTATEGLVYFSASDARHGRELWVTDGTAAGTRIVEDVRSGPAGSDPRDFLATEWYLGGVIYTADDGRSGREPWRSDGSIRGTRLSRDIAREPDRAASSDPTELTYTWASVFMSVDDGVHGREVWGVAYRNEVVDVMPGPAGSDPHAFAVATPSLDVFFAADGPEGDDVLYGCLDQCDQHVRIGIGTEPVAGVTATTVVADRVFFVAEGVPETAFLGVARAGWSQDWSLRKVVTIDAASVVLTEPAPSVDPPLEGPFAELTAFDGRLVLAVDDATRGTELWMSDGTPEGTAPIIDLKEADLDPEDLTLVGDALWFSADPDDGTGREPWLTDGTSAGTVLAADVAPDGGSDPVDFTAFRDLVVFSADDGLTGRELWLSDGTEDGTRLLLDIRPGPDGSDPSGFAVLGR